MEKRGIKGADFHHLQAVEGWLALGNPLEALIELDRVSSSLHQHPEVLDARWQVSAALRDWDAALAVGNLMVQKVPDDPGSWISRSYALRRAKNGGIHSAWEALAPAASKFPSVSIIPYNIACYAAQLGNLSEAWDWIHRAIEAEGDIKKIKEMAMRDPDLQPLWERIKGL